MLIALTGPKGCGKTTIAEELVKSQDFTRLRFAGPIKDMLRALGLTAEQVDGDLKEKPSALLGGKTPREAMQDLGTRWGREFDPSLWVRATMHRVDGLRLAHRDVIIDDCRFANEAHAVRQAGGVIVEVVRPGVHYSHEHASEFPLDEELVDYRITNTTPDLAAAELLTKLLPE